MDNLNKTVSFVLGLVVVLVFLAIVTGRLNLKNKLPLLGSKATPTPSQKIITQKITTNNEQSTTSVPNSTGAQNPAYNQYQVVQGKTPATIPSTGSPTLLLPLLFSGLGGGLLLKKKSNKKQV